MAKPSTERRSRGQGRSRRIFETEFINLKEAISWKPWQHDKPYADHEEIVKEAVDVLHFVANIIVAAGGTDEMLDKFYIEKMERNKQRQLDGYKVKEIGVKCALCARAIDDVGRGASPDTCAKCLPKEVDGNA